VGKLGEYCTRTTQYKHKRKEGRRTPTINRTPMIANDQRTEDQGEQGRTWRESRGAGKKAKTIALQILKSSRGGAKKKLLSKGGCSAYDV
tara:strand:- start:475 stop:744 length:270 start_codon:yes stop_codon:yes gene_type:complete